MSALCVVFEKIHDQEKFDEYRSRVLATIESFGGRFLVRGGEHVVLEGSTDYERFVVLEFDSREIALEWYHSPAYQAVLPLRLDATECLFMVLDGVTAGS